MCTKRLARGKASGSAIIYSISNDTLGTIAKQAMHISSIQMLVESAFFTFIFSIGAWRSVKSSATAVGRPSPTPIAICVWRSEERRVGKECRSRWSPYFRSGPASCRNWRG